MRRASTDRRPWARAVFAAALASLPVAALAQNYIGAERCRSCHEFEYQVWARGPHQRSHLALTAEQQADPKCNTCHTMAAEGAAEGVPNATGIECERCHGPGKYYHPRYVMKDRELARAVGLIDPTPAHCQQCHTEGAPSIRPFSYEELWTRIDHGKSAREAWERAQQTPPAASTPK